MAAGDDEGWHAGQLGTTGEGAREVTRIGGAERIETAALVSQAFFDAGQDVVFVARHDDYPDALTGGPAVALFGSPILLVTPNRVPEVTADELERLAPGRIVILGGEAAVSGAVEAALADYTEVAVTRFAGPSRFETAAEIATEEFDPGVGTAYVATGLNWPDALSGGAAAAFEQGPVLLVQTHAIHPATAEALETLQPERIVVLGGTAVVAPEVEAALADYTEGPVERFSGPTRFETSTDISARTFAPEDTETVFIATGTAFADALSGAPAASLLNAPMLLVTRTSVPAAVADELERLRGDGDLDIVLLGGTAAISAAVAAELERYTGALDRYANEVRADDPLGYWRLEETSGTTAANEIAGGTTATVVDGSLDADGPSPQLGSALALPGSAGNRLALGVISDADDLDAWTWEVWLNVDSIGALAGLFGEVTHESATTIRIFEHPGGGAWFPQARFRPRSDPDDHFGWPLPGDEAAIKPYGQWLHFVTTVEGAQTATPVARVYYDGEEVIGFAMDEPIMAPYRQQNLGARDNNSGEFEGRFDEPAFYAHALSPARIRAHYEAGAATLDEP